MNFQYFKNLFLPRDTETAKLLLAKVLVNQNLLLKKPPLDRVEFKVYSQFGDDGIIQHLISHAILESDEKNFVEFGVEDYQEANTRFLLINNHWRGLVMELDRVAVDRIMKDPLYWKVDLTAISTMITTGNINQVLKRTGFDKKLGFLSIDIDGNDYWICEKIISQQKPVIVVVEYNALWGIQKKVTIPYKSNFSRFKGHYSGVYWGASLGAFRQLLSKKGYMFLGTNSLSLNAYFVRRDRLGKLEYLGRRPSIANPKIRDSRNSGGKLDFLDEREKLKLLADHKLYDLESEKILKVKEIFKL